MVVFVDLIPLLHTHTHTHKHTVYVIHTQTYYACALMHAYTQRHTLWRNMSKMSHILVPTGLLKFLKTEEEQIKCQNKKTPKARQVFSPSKEISHKSILGTFCPQTEWLVSEGNVNKEISRSQAPTLVILQKELSSILPVYWHSCLVFDQYWHSIDHQWHDCH